MLSNTTPDELVRVEKGEWPPWTETADMLVLVRQMSDGGIAIYTISDLGTLFSFRGVDAQNVSVSWANVQKASDTCTVVKSAVRLIDEQWIGEASV